jgi:predicted TIM-barrel fold metal-dependent hydrolase
LAAQRSYTPPEALATQYLALLARLGLSHGVLVHPSAYGDDFSLLLHALSAHPTPRGVIVVRPGTLPALTSLRDQGVRAERFSHRSGSGANFRRECVARLSAGAGAEPGRRRLACRTVD